MKFQFICKIVVIITITLHFYITLVKVTLAKWGTLVKNIKVIYIAVLLAGFQPDSVYIYFFQRNFTSVQMTLRWIDPKGDSEKLKGHQKSQPDTQNTL